MNRAKCVSLTTPKFSCTKVMIDRVVVDIRVLWDSKSSGHNTTMWALGSMLPDCGVMEEHAAKWLLTIVRAYLQGGSPDQDYT